MKGHKVYKLYARWKQVQKIRGSEHGQHDRNPLPRTKPHEAEYIARSGQWTRRPLCSCHLSVACVPLY